MEDYNHLEALFQVQTMILLCLSRAESECSKKEWSDKLERNQKEIDSIIKSLS